LVLLSIAGTIALAAIRRPEGPAGALAGPEPITTQNIGETAPPAPAREGPFLGVVLARASVDLAPRYEGRLREVHVRLGDSVAAGDPIASIHLPTARLDLTMAEATLKVTQVERDRAAIELADSQDRLARRKALAAEALATGEELATAQYQRKLADVRVESMKAQLGEKRARVEQLRQMNAEAEVRAPFAGIIAARYADPGANVTPATPIVRLISAGDLFVRFALPEEALSGAAVGMAARVAVGDAIFHGTIDKIAPEVDAASRMVTVEARLDLGADPKAQPLSGEIARVSLLESAQ
jgi:RND family efflux transporter MFP subunit